ncbi:MAG: SDR family oxidoreductase [Chlorobium sp.]|nr:MAG: SDR family oxidoreductase [Chlorobium sp.]
MKPRILITGGSGLLAINWVKMLHDSYSVILCLHNRVIDIPGVETKKINLDSIDHLVRTFESFKPDIVVHTASLTNVEKCESAPALAQYINVTLAENVAKATAQLGISLVHISSDHLFSGKKLLVGENSPVDPVNVYGRTKAEAESRVIEAHPESLVIRTNFYGWGTSYRRSFSDIIIESLRAGNELTLFQDVFYTPILIETLVNTVHDLVKHKSNGIFHVVGVDRISKYDFGLMLAERFNLDASLISPGNISDQPSLVQRPHDMSLSNNKIVNLFGRIIGSVSDDIEKLFLEESKGFTQELLRL